MKEMNEKFERSLSIERAVDANDEERTVELAFSSEAPYERAFGIEVLDHDPSSVQLERLNDGAAVLVNHDSDDQVGVVEMARVDGDRVGRAKIRFGRSQRATEIYNDVKDGIRRQVSVGYRINGYDITERSDEPDLVRVTNWMPYEISIVSTAADPSVGIGRSETDETPDIPVEETPIEPTTDEVIEMTEEVKAVEAPAVDHAAELTKIRTDEARRVDAIRAMADKYEALGSTADEAIREGWDVAKFNGRALEVIGEQNQAARQASGHDGEVDLSEKERAEFSMVRLMDAISNPADRAAQSRAGFELEVSAAAQRDFGSDFQCRGEFVPTSLLEGQRNLTAGTPTAGGNLVATDLMASAYIDVLRNASSVTRAGMTVMSGLVGNVDIPRQTSATASTWISAEDGDATQSEPTFDQVSLTPKDLACYTEMSRRLLMQSTPAVEGIVRNDLATAQALGIDAAALYGTGTGGQPRGVANQAGIGSVTFAAADPTYNELIAMVKELAAANALRGNVSFLIEANGWEALSTTSKQSGGAEGNFILNDADRIVGYPYIMSNQVAAEDYFVGVFSDLLMGEWGGLEISVDPFTHSLKGRVRYVTFKTCDIAVRHPESFVLGNDGL